MLLDICDLNGVFDTGVVSVASSPNASHSSSKLLQVDWNGIMDEIAEQEGKTLSSRDDFQVTRFLWNHMNS